VYQFLKTSLLEHMYAEEVTLIPALQRRTHGKLHHRLGRMLRAHYERYSKHAAAVFNPCLLVMASARWFDDFWDWVSPCLDCSSF
jgi:hypothetical protein